MSLRGKRSDCGNPLEKARSVYFVDLPPSREFASLRSQRRYDGLGDSSVGYFAYAQYDVKKTIVGVADDSGM